MRFKDIVLWIFLMYSFQCYSNTWEQFWTEGIIACENQKFKEGIEKFSNALTLVDKESSNFPTIYVDRGRSYMLLDKYDEAILDFNVAIESSHIMLDQRIRALKGKMMSLFCLEKGQEALKCLEELERIDPSIPKAQFTEDYIIIRNVPKCECYKKITVNILLNAGVCESIEDISFLSSNICIAKRSCKYCQKSHSVFDGPTGAEEDCRWYCDQAIIAAGVWCGKVFKSLKCQMACAYAANALKQGCYWCCDSGDFYQKCVKPFERLVDFVPCDPMWD